ncbi:MAG: ImmA/IrrE family metallo-endopeptidase [Solirubrobacterales bacterium]|nr:ImmA/IrrE family metallo-endopeptidase [Solirubrobacterales bacterium]
MPAEPLRTEELAARRLRQSLRLGEVEPIADIVDAVESAGVDCFLTELPRPIAGLAGRVNGRWYVVADSTIRSAGRTRFTLAHEFGHVVMGHEPSVDDEDTLRARDGGALPLEVQANYFAAEFLLPRHAVEDRATARGVPFDADQITAWIEELAGDHGVTAWVALYRMRTVGLLGWAEQKAVEQRLSPSRPPDTRGDTVSALAGTGATRMPKAYELRQRQLAEAGKDSDEDDGGLW